MPQVWAVIGPTASGKSDAAFRLAQKYGGEIISCDSVQVTRFFDIGSAKPSLSQRSAVPHHLIDILNPSVPCTAGFWRAQALQAVEGVWARGRLPIIAGGTGLYFKALYQGLFEGLSTNPLVRSALEAEAERQGLPAFFARLQQIDPAYAKKISANDKLRIIRALEAFTVSGRPFSELHQNNHKPNWEWTLIMPDVSKEELAQRIALRTEKMLEQGLLGETLSLTKRFPGAPALESIGYKESCAVLQGRAPESGLKDEVTLHTRQFAKRQMSLFRSLCKDVRVFKPEEFL